MKSSKPVTVTVNAVKIFIPCLFQEYADDLAAFIAIENEKCVPQDQAVYEQTMQNLTMISDWHAEQVNNLAKWESELTLEQINALYGENGEIAQHIKKLQKSPTIIGANDKTDARLSDSDMREQLLSRLETLNRYVQKKRNELLILQQLSDSCENDEQYRSLKPHVKLMLNVTTRLEKPSSSSAPDSGEWTDEPKREIALQQLQAFARLMENAPANFSDRLFLDVRKTKKYWEFDVSIAIRSQNENFSLEKVNTSFQD
ncbi:hypothetical protein SOPP22_02275 [Shewanella sp. OPT22]|nr:hypothetical protein SOPP22_02275 [Shewanella sp. OPT22]